MDRHNLFNDKHEYVFVGSEGIALTNSQKGFHAEDSLHPDDAFVLQEKATKLIRDWKKPDRENGSG